MVFKIGNDTENKQIRCKKEMKSTLCQATGKRHVGNATAAAAPAAV